MSKMIKVILCLLCAIVLILTISSTYNLIMLKVEETKIKPNGKVIKVNGHSMHIYTEGNSDEKPTLVFLSGSGTVSPIYDFKSLYSKLTDDYRIIVVEKAGYGYSEIYNISRDIDTLVDETRQVLTLAGEKPPYILLPHSMSGLEAVYWAQSYPDEVHSIIGLDMAVPRHYQSLDFKKTDRLFIIGNVVKRLGLLRIFSFAYPLNEDALSETEITQQRYLMLRNALNQNFIEEGKAVKINAEKVSERDYPKTKTILFASNGQEVGDFWIPYMEEYSNIVNGEIVYLDCAHYIHYFESESIAKGIKEFLQ